MEWVEFKEAVKTALANNDTEELNHLKWLDGRWYEDAIEEITEEGAKI